MKSVVQTNDRMCGIGIVNTFCFSSRGIFLVRTYIAFVGNSLLHCSVVLCFLRSSSLISFLCGHIRRELWECAFLRGCAYFVVCFSFIKLWEAKDCFKYLRVQDFVKAIFMISLAIKHL